MESGSLRVEPCLSRLVHQNVQNSYNIDETHAFKCRTISELYEAVLGYAYKPLNQSWIDPTPFLSNCILFQESLLILSNSSRKGHTREDKSAWWINVH